LPDGIFSNQKSQFGSISEGLETVNVGILCGLWYYTYIVHLVYFYGHLAIKWKFGILYQEKSGNPDATI
jgi:hypothetical protein